MNKPFICNSAIVIDWEGHVYLCPNNDEDNVLAARFNVHDPEYPPLFVAGEELDGWLELHDITCVKLDDASPSQVRQDDDCIDEHDTTVTGIVADVNTRERTARIKVDSFPADITVYDECTRDLDVGARVMLVGDLVFCYEEE